MYGNHSRGHGYNNNRDRSREKNNSRRQRSSQRDQYQYHSRKRRSRSRSNDKNERGQRYDRERSQRGREKSGDRGDRGDRGERYDRYERYDRSERYRRDSRSNSRDREKKISEQQSYPQRQTQEIEQKLRVAIRNNEIHFEAKLLQILRNMPLSRQEQIKDQAESIQKIHQCILVRQLFISGLQQMSEQFIQQIMKQFGEIQKIQIVRNFAYVKFHRVEDASNACAEYHSINQRIHNVHNPNFKIFFADHVKRWNVVSNSIAFQNQDLLVPVVYASLRNQHPFNTEAHVREAFEKFGFIRNIQVKIPAMKPYKTYALVQYETLSQALRARERIRPFRQKYLGDRKSQVTLLLDSEKVTRQCPNVKNQLRYQIKRQHNSNPLPPQKTMNPFLQSHEAKVQQQSINTNNAGAGANDQDIFAMIREFADKQQQNQEQEYDWAGFLTRKKQFKVEVDFNLIHKVPFELESILNVSHRGELMEGINREDYVMAGKFKAANSLNVAPFNEYISYFIKKNKAGIIQTKNYLIYLLPPIESLPLPYPTKSDQILALFFKL